MTQQERNPIVYVRGFAGDTGGIDRAVGDPFYGFNDGSTQVRVSGGGDPVFHQFEGPLWRLHLDEGYEILVDGGQMAYLETHDKVPAASIWIHRFYDASASAWGEKPQEFSIERAAENLLALIEKLQIKTGAPRVVLVAHSMGGLVCRCLIQKIIPDTRPGRPATDYVDKLFTYATPHGGIEFDVGFGLLERLRDRFAIAGADIFGPDRMHQYLTPSGRRDRDRDWRPQQMPDGFPLERVFCLIGTNPEEYDAAKGMSSRLVGAKTDGLVQIENAYVPGARHAFVHRSHSGPYGVVNSEEGYQNLRRFLFGDLEIQADLVKHRLPAGATWQADVRLSIRGLSVVMHEQTAATWCPIQLTMPGAESTADRPEPLVTTFLNSHLPRPGAGPMRYALHLRIYPLRERDGIFDFRNHLEQVGDFDDILVVDVGTRHDRMVAWAVWNSTLSGAIGSYQPTVDPLLDEDQDAGTWEAEVPLPSTAVPILGQEARVRLTVRSRAF